MIMRISDRRSPTCQPRATPWERGIPQKRRALKGRNNALRYAEKRGFSADEVREAILWTPWTCAEYGEGRMQCSEEFAFGQDWNGKTYKTKRVRPVFVEEETEIVVVTV